MKITDILFSQKGGKMVLSASIQFRGHKPEQMYFATDVRNLSYIASDASPFLAAVLLPCMKTHEDIEIDGSVSETLLTSTHKIMELVESWNVGLKPVEISIIDTTHVILSEVKRSRGISSPQATLLKRSLGSARDDNKRIACFFSAGVDSFYTYLKHPEITDFILIHGFDIPLENTSLFETVKNTVRNIANKEKVNLLSVETNVADIIEPKLVWDFAHGGALTACALFLRKQLQSVYIASAVQNDEIFPYGTHPQLDKLWSTETLTFKHDGTEYNRLGKIMHVVSKSNLALSNLHVCAQNLKGKYNCSRCYKCLITMIELICVKANEKAKTFDWPIDLEAVANMYYDYALIYNTQGEANLAILKEQDREPELQQAIQVSLLKSRNPGLSKKLYKLISGFDQKYNDRRLYRMVFHLTGTQDRNILFKILQRRGILK